MIEIVNKTVLKNGVKILTQKMPYAQSVSMGVWVNVGARDENEEENGISHFIEHMIFKGTKKRSAFQIAKEFDSIGGQTNAFTAMEQTCYYAKVLSEHIEIMADILSDVFLNSVFDPREIERELQVVLQEIGLIEDSPEDYIHVLSNNNFWGNNSLGRTVVGSRENVIKFDSNMIKSFFKNSYHPEKIYISVAGDIDHNKLVDLVAPLFEKIENKRPLVEKNTPNGLYKISINPRELEQIHLCLDTLGMSANDPRRYEYSLMNTILGGNMSSRLFQEIREIRGLAYTVCSYCASFSDTGVFGVYMGCDPEKVHESISVVLNEVDKLRKVSVSEEELNSAKQYTKASIKLSSESSDAQMSKLAQNEINFGRYIPIDEVIQNFESVTIDNIYNIAQLLFKPNELALTILGPISSESSFESLIYR
ncbi:MAG: insulinase family protein [Desulfobacterales bacterium]|nr:insulinase family protein [Desulfobacterales bacterium]